MNDKQQLLTALREEFDRWEAQLASKGDEQILARRSSSDLSIKDVIAHLRAWQQVSIARLEAALSNGEPVFPDWLDGCDPESEDQIDRFNARIYAANRERPWASVHGDWQAGFRRFLELAESISDKDLFDARRYPWLNGYRLADVLVGSYEHHHEHFESTVIPAKAGI